MYGVYFCIRRYIYLWPHQSRVTEVEQQCRVQLTTMEAETAQLKQEREADAAAAAKRVEGQQTLSFLSNIPHPLTPHAIFLDMELKNTCSLAHI